MNKFLVGLLGLLAVTLAIVRSADHLHALWRGRPNLRRPAVLAAATSVSSTLYAHCVGNDFFLLTAALINAANAVMGVLLPTASAAVTPPPVEQPGNVEEGP